MTQMNRTIKNWTILLLALMTIAFLAACSGGDQMLLAEFNRDGEADIFLAGLGDEESSWQELANNVTSAHLFAGEYAAFVPDSDRIILWYVDGNELRVEQLKVGDEVPTPLFEADANEQVFGSFTSDPFAVYLTESRGFNDNRCFVSRDGAEAERLARSSRCSVSEQGVVSLDFGRNGLTVTLISLDGEDETVILNEVEDVEEVRWNEDRSTFVYAEEGRRDVQLFTIEPGDEEGVPLGAEYAVVDSFGFLLDGKTIYVIGKVDEDHDEVGLFINGSSDPLLENETISWSAQSEDGDLVVFVSSDSREAAAFVYNVADETVTEIVEDDIVSVGGFANGRLLIFAGRDDSDLAILSANGDGSDTVELFQDDNYFINYSFLNPDTGQLIVRLTDEDGLQSLFISGTDEADGYFLLEEWDSISIVNASKEYLVFVGREDDRDDYFLYSILLEPDAAEIELDDDARDGFRGVFFSANGRSLLYTALDDGLQDTEVRQVLVDGSERPETLFKDRLLLDVNWDGRADLQFIR